MNTGKHIEGSRKQKVHALYDAQGPEAAFTLARKLGLKENSARSWFSQWRRADDTSKGKAKVVKPTSSTRKAKVAKSASAVA